MSDDTGVAQARERFLTAGPVGPGQVRDVILASWWRSRDWHVAADRVDPSYVGDPHPDTPLARGAAPVLRSLRESLDGQPVSVILTDAEGVALCRLTADRDLERRLDWVQLAPGFSYAERLVGTNGIGTALESGQPVHVFGHEHYAEHLEDLACAAAPIRHPVSGKTVGAVNLTCWRADADRLLVALVKTASGQITRALLDDSGARELQLLQEYRRACRHTGGIVMAVANDMVLLNDHARDALDPADQAALLAHAADALASGHRGPADIGLPTGARARIFLRPLRDEDGRRNAGGVMQARLLEPASPQAAGAVAGRPARRLAPGLAGSGPLWLRSCRLADAACAAGEWLCLEGEPGVGKLALLQAVHQRRNPAGPFHVLDAAATGHDWLARARGELLDGTGILVIRHLDRLGARPLQALSVALQQAPAARRQRQPWTAVTLGLGPASSDLASLLKFFPGTVTLPPLRHHVEDLHELVPFFLARLSQHGPLSCSPEAMQVLLRSRWPGNTGQLWQVLRQVARRRRSGIILPGDLPPECWSVSRRLLSPLESMQRDAIVQGLVAHDGNKAKTAQSLGLSRATIYRKIHDYGIITPAS